MMLHGDNRATPLLALGLGCLLVLGSSCGGQAKKKKKPEKFDFPIEVEVLRTNEEPVPEVPVKLDGKVVGYTDADGSFSGTLRARPGTNVTLSAGELDGFRYIDDKNEKSIRLKTKKNLSGKGRSGVPVLLNTVVESTQNFYMVWVKTECDEETMDPEDCRDLPVKMDGEQVATTGYEGTAHFMFQTEPTGSKTITVDTPESEDEDDEVPTYEPADPEFKAELRSDPTIFVFEKSFEDPDAEPEQTWHPPPDRTSGSDEGGSSSDDSSSSGGGGDSDDGSSEVIDVFD